MKTKTMKLKCLIGVSLVTIIYSAKPVFREDAKGFVKWKFKDRPTLDVSKIVLEWEPFEMVLDRSSIDRNELLNGSVLIRSGDGEYKPVTDSPRVSGEKYLLTIPIVPCQGVRRRRRRRPKICCQEQRW